MAIANLQLTLTIVSNILLPSDTDPNELCSPLQWSKGKTPDVDPKSTVLFICFTLSLGLANSEPLMAETEGPLSWFSALSSVAGYGKYPGSQHLAQQLDMANSCPVNEFDEDLSTMFYKYQVLKNQLLVD